jgi:DNA-binding MarR family transcriptional regulator
MTENAVLAPFERIAGECLAVRMRLLNRVVTRLYDDALRPFGLKVSQLNLLVAAGCLGRARPAEVCKRLEIDPSTLSRNLDRMRRKGWLEAVDDDDDGRTHPFRLSAKGKRLVERAYPAWQAAQGNAAELLGNEGTALLRRAVANL